MGGGAQSSKFPFPAAWGKAGRVGRGGAAGGGLLGPRAPDSRGALAPGQAAGRGQAQGGQEPRLPDLSAWSPGDAPPPSQ